MCKSVNIFFKMSIIEKAKQYSLICKIGVYLSIVYYDFICDSFLLLKVKLRMLGLLHEKKYAPIRSLKNIHHGERCFIVATGPSLTFEDLHKLKGEFVFGVNSLVKILDKLEFIPNYLGIQDELVYKKIGDMIEECQVKHVFMTDKLYHKYCKRKDGERYIIFPKYNCRHSSHGEMRPLTSGFSNDPSIVVYDGYSITYSLLQIAVYMGFSEIYLLGCDCSYDVNGGKQHFVESGHFDKQAATVGERMIYAFGVAKRYLDEHKPDVKVYNSTRGGMLEVFPRMTLEEVFASQ